MESPPLEIPRAALRPGGPYLYRGRRRGRVNGWTSGPGASVKGLSGTLLTGYPPLGRALERHTQWPWDRSAVGARRGPPLTGYPVTWKGVGAPETVARRRRNLVPCGVAP